MFNKVLCIEREVSKTIQPKGLPFALNLPYVRTDTNTDSGT
jgi:hypothetical protein